MSLDLKRVTWSKFQLTLIMGTSHGKRALLIWYPRSSASEDIMYLICHLTSNNQVIKASWKFMGESSSQYYTTLMSLVNTREMIMKIYLSDDIFKGLCDFMGASSSQQFITLKCLLAISLVEVELSGVYFFTLPHKNTRLKDHATLWVEIPHYISPPCKVRWL